VRNDATMWCTDEEVIEESWRNWNTSESQWVQSWQRTACDRYSPLTPFPCYEVYSSRRSDYSMWCKWNHLLHLRYQGDVWSPRNHHVSDARALGGEVLPCGRNADDWRGPSFRLRHTYIIFAVHCFHGKISTYWGYHQPGPGSVCGVKCKIWGQWFPYSRKSETVPCE
jgi:hypothetical protein